MNDAIRDEQSLDRLIAEPPQELVDQMRSLDGDITILGIAGKMGVHLGAMALNAARKAGAKTQVVGVSRFSDPAERGRIESLGIRTIACDLLDPHAVDSLPPSRNVIFMAGRKFGTGDNADLTWAINTIAPANVCRHFADSRIVAFSTGCVYDLVPTGSGGSREEDDPRPTGDYAQSALGRERVFSYYSRTGGTPVCIVRLNYSVEMRYGVLHDIAMDVYNGRPVDLTMGHANVIWQGDAVAHSLLCIGQCSSPASIMNVTGPETLSVRALAEKFARLFDRPVTFTGKEDATAYLSNAAKAFQLFGKPRVSADTVADWTAEWVMSGGRSLGKPTHFTTRNGKY